MPALIGNLSRLLISNQAMTLEEIAKATEDDDAVTTGSTLFITQDELSTSQGLLLRETWIVMPESRVLKPSPWPMRTTKEWCAPSNYCDRRFGDPAWTSKPSSKQAYPVSLPNHKLYQNHFVLQQCTPDRGKRFILTFVGIFPW